MPNGAEPMNKNRGICEVVAGSRQMDGAGVKLLRVLGPAQTSAFDPFLLLDAFDSRNPDDYVRGFPWHPHRGIETVTYLIAGDVEHGDSLGNSGHIRDGGCQWMTAGSGILHQEMPRASPRMLGLQLWVNLPRADKWARPQYRDITADRVPVVEKPGSAVRVVSGEYGGARGATQGDYVKTLLLDVALQPGARWSAAVDPAATLFLYTIQGEGVCCCDGGGTIKARRAVLFGEGDGIAVEAGGTGMRFMLFAGRPLREPIAWGGPIVMNTDEELDRAFEEIRNGTFVRESGAEV